MPVIEAAVTGQPAILTPADVADIEDLLEAFAAKGSPKLKSTIQKIESDFHQEKFATYFGTDAEDSY